MHGIDDEELRQLLPRLRRFALGLTRCCKHSSVARIRPTPERTLWRSTRTTRRSEREQLPLIHT